MHKVMLKASNLLVCYLSVETRGGEGELLPGHLEEPALGADEAASVLEAALVAVVHQRLLALLEDQVAGTVLQRAASPARQHQVRDGRQLQKKDNLKA